MKRVVGALLISLFLSHQMVAATRQETHLEILRTYVQYYIESQQSEKAFTKIQKHLGRYPKDPEAFSLRGLVFLQDQKPKMAMKEFERANQVASSPKQKAQYLIYRAYASALAGDYKEAARILKDLQKTRSYRSAVARLVEGIQNRNLPRLSEIQLEDEESAEDKKNLILGIAGGYDSNVLLLSNTLLESLSQSDTHSAYVKASLLGSISRDSATRKSNFFSRLAYTSYLMENAREYSTFGFLSGLSFMNKHSKFVHNGFSNLLNASLINQNTYEIFSATNTFRFDTRLNWTDKIYTEIQLPLTYQLFNSDEDTEEADLRSGASAGINGVHMIQFGPHRFNVRSSFLVTYAEGANFDSRSFAQSLSWSTKMGPRLRARASARFRLIDYPSHTEDRSDQQLNPSLQLSYSVMKKLQLKAAYNFIFNRSNVDDSEYVKHDASLSLSYSIF